MRRFREAYLAEMEAKAKAKAEAEHRRRVKEATLKRMSVITDKSKRSMSLLQRSGTV